MNLPGLKAGASRWYDLAMAWGCGSAGLHFARGSRVVKERLEVGDERSNVDQGDGAGSTAALLVTLIVVVLIAVLFLLFKFNLFNGGTSVNVRTTLPAWSPWHGVS